MRKPWSGTGSPAVPAARQGHQQAETAQLLRADAGSIEGDAGRTLAGAAAPRQGGEEFGIEAVPLVAQGVFRDRRPILAA